MALSGLVMVISTDVLDVVLGVLLCYLLPKLCQRYSFSSSVFLTRGEIRHPPSVFVKGIDISFPSPECISGDFT